MFVLFVWSAAGGAPGEGHLGVPAGPPAASGLDVTAPEVWLEPRHPPRVTEMHRCRTGMFEPRSRKSLSFVIYA